MKGKRFFKDPFYYYVIYNKIDGLELSSPVVINGMKVGKVREINFMPNRKGLLIVRFDLEKKFDIPDSTIAQIYSMDIMGTKAIQLSLGKSKKMHNVGDTLISSMELDLKDAVSAQVLPLKIKAEGLILAVDSILQVIKYIFNENTRDNMKQSFESIKLTVANLESTSKNLDTLVTSERGKLSRIFSNIESISFNLKTNNDKITNILNNFSSLSDTLVKSNIKNVILNADRILSKTNKIIEDINNGKGTIGMLINNDSLYRNLENASNNLNKLVFDINENPKRYVHFSIFDRGRTYLIKDKGELDKLKKKEKKKLDDRTNDNNVIFKVQIKAANKQITKKSREFNNYDSLNIEELFINGKYKYTIGKKPSYIEILKLQNDLKILFPDAFIVAFKNGEQISINDAIKNWYNKLSLSFYIPPSQVG